MADGPTQEFATTDLAKHGAIMPALAPDGSMFGAVLRFLGAPLQISPASLRRVNDMYLAIARSAAASVVVTALPLLSLGCTTAPRDDAPPSVSAVASADAFVAHVEPAPDVRFPLPRTGMHLDVKSFDPTLPAEKFRHELRFVTDANDVEVIVNEWDNPRGQDVHAWFEENLTRFVGEATAVRERTAGKDGLAAIEIDEPASEQAFSESMVVFATHAHVYLVTAIDPEGVPHAKMLFERVVAGFEPEISTKLAAPAKEAR